MGYIVEQVAPAYVELHVRAVLLIEPKACSIEMHFKVSVVQLSQLSHYARTNVPSVYAVVLHSVFMAQMGLQGKKIGSAVFLIARNGSTGVKNCCAKN
jgi:hypothetical protein